MMRNSLFNKVNSVQTRNPAVTLDLYIILPHYLQIITNDRYNLKNSAVSYCVQSQQDLIKELGSGSSKISQAMKNYLIKVKEYGVFYFFFFLLYKTRT